MTWGRKGVCWGREEGGKSSLAREGSFFTLTEIFTTHREEVSKWLKKGCEIRSVQDDRQQQRKKGAANEAFETWARRVYFRKRNMQANGKGRGVGDTCKNGETSIDGAL